MNRDIEVPNKRFLSRVTRELASAAAVEAGRRAKLNAGAVGTIGRVCDSRIRGKVALELRRMRSEALDILKSRSVTGLMSNGLKIESWRELDDLLQPREIDPSSGIPLRSKTQCPMSPHDFFLGQKHLRYFQHLPSY